MTTPGGDDTGSAASPPDPLSAVHVLVMAKVPVAGAVKTRLARRLGAVAACRLYTAFVGDLAARLNRTGARVTWAWTPAALTPPDVGPRARHIVQRGPDLGARMADGVAAVWQLEPLPVLVLGVDAPHVPETWWRDGAAALLTGTDVVLGPATDGGYWMIGLREPVPELFTDVAWGTDTVYATTVARVRALGLSLATLPQTFDVDTWDDLKALRAATATDGVSLPATRRVLATLPA